MRQAHDSCRASSEANSQIWQPNQRIELSNFDIANVFRNDLQISKTLFKWRQNGISSTIYWNKIVPSARFMLKTVFLVLTECFVWF